MKSKLANGILWATAAAVIGLVVITRLSLPESSESIALREKTELDRMGQTCLDSLKPDLKDPFSARVVSVVRSTEDPREYAINYRAKNSYGAYGAGDTVCVISDGKVVEPTTSMRRLIIITERRVEQQKVYNSCMNSSNLLLSQGKSEESKELECDQYKPAD